MILPSSWSLESFPGLEAYELLVCDSNNLANTVHFDVFTREEMGEKSGSEVMHFVPVSKILIETPCITGRHSTTTSTKATAEIISTFSLYSHAISRYHKRPIIEAWLSCTKARTSRSLYPNPSRIRPRERSAAPNRMRDQTISSTPQASRPQHHAHTPSYPVRALNPSPLSLPSSSAPPAPTSPLPPSPTTSPASIPSSA